MLKTSSVPSNTPTPYVVRELLVHVYSGELGGLRVIKEYRCPTCGERAQQEESITNAPPLPPLCNFCGIRMEWAPTGMSFELKGKGWPGKEIKR